MVNVPTKIIKPRGFDIILELHGVTWRRIQFEMSSDEAGVSDEHETIEPPQRHQPRPPRPGHRRTGDHSAEGRARPGTDHAPERPRPPSQASSRNIEAGGVVMAQSLNAVPPTGGRRRPHRSTRAADSLWVIGREQEP